MGLVPNIIVNDWESVRQAVAKLATKLGTGADVTHASVILTDLTASRILSTSASKSLTSVSNLASWVAGVANETDVIDDGDGTITIGIVNPLIVGKGGSGAATFTDHGILLGSGTDAFTALGAATNGQLPIGSTGADPTLAGLTGTTNQITVTNAAGSITLAIPQDIHTAATPTFAGLILSKTVTATDVIHSVTTALSLSESQNVNLKGLYFDLTNYSLAVGKTDTGEKYGIEGSAAIYNAGFAGNAGYFCGGRFTAGVELGTSGATVTTVWGFWGRILNRVAGVTITNAYACYLSNNETTGTITNRYDLYCASTLAKNYFAGNVGIGLTTFGANATQTLALGTGVAPTDSPADAFQMYSADFAAGQACPHFRTEGGTVIKLNQDLATIASPTLAGLTLTSFSGIIKATVGVLAGGAAHADLASIDTDQHVAHSGVSISAGTGMSGGGTIAATRTLTCTITQYTDALARATISTTATGLTYTSSTGVLSLTALYVIPTTTQETNWNTAYTDRLKWDGGATGLNAATGRTSLELGTIATQSAASVTIAGGTIAGLTGLAIRDTSAAYDVTIIGTSSTILTLGRTLTIDMVNVASTIKLGYNLTLSAAAIIGGTNTGDVTVSDSSSIDFTLTGQQISAVVLPAGVDHNSLLNYAANQHFVQTAITNVSTALSTGLLKVTTTTGALSVITDSSTNWDAAYTHSQIAGGNSVHVSTTENTNWDAAYSHISNVGTDHSYINQSVKTTDAPQFADGLKLYTTSSGDVTFLALRHEGTLAFGANLGLNTDVTGDFFISTRASGSNTKRLTIQRSNGNVGIGIDLPLAKVHIDQSSTTGAIPVLTLDQADVSEEVIRIIGTAADNILTQTLVASADVTTFTPTGYLKVYISDDGNQITDGYYYLQFGNIV